jgi:site-specific recombinase XerC
MASLFKLRFNQYVDKSGKRVTKCTPGAKAKRYTSEKWYGQYRDENNVIKRVPLDEDETRSRELLAELELKAARYRRGLTDPSVRFAETPFADHVREYARHMVQKGNSKDHIADTTRYLTKIATSCGFAFLRDVAPAGIRGFMLNLKSHGLADRTVNAHLTAIKGFLNWCVRENRSPSNPIAYMAELKNHEQSRRPRRIISHEDRDLLLRTAAESEVVWRRISGKDRAMIYAMALGTGLRAKEISSLCLASLDLDAAQPTATVEAAYSKRRRRDEQPLPTWLVTRLREWLRDRELQPGDKLFPGGWPERAAEMLRVDLEAAKIPYEDGGEFFDFHSQRHNYISGFSSAGVHPKIAQSLARHSSIELTMNRYTHLLHTDVAGALDRIPGPAAAPEKQSARATGTYGPDDACCTNVCATDVNERVQKSMSGKLGSAARDRSKRSQHGAAPKLAMMRSDDDEESGPLAPSDWNSGAGQPVVGSNPMPSALICQQVTAIEGTTTPAPVAPMFARDEQLVAVIDAWPHLPEAKRECILAILNAHRQTLQADLRRDGFSRTEAQAESQMESHRAARRPT